LLDGTPVVKDVVLSRAQAGVDGETGSAWRSVLLIGDRDGGRGMAALDVTDPTTSNWQFMWDISAEAGRCVQGEVACNPDNDSHPERNDFSMLGRTWGRPEIGSVQVCPDETTSCVPRETKLRELAVAVIPGGNGSGLGSDAGKSVFVVRMDTGARLAEFKSGNANVFNNCSVSDHQIDADMVGSVACFSTFPGTFMSRCFMGDAAGRLWRLELGSEITSAWTLTMFYDPYKSLSPVPTLSSPIRAPVYEAPALAIQSLTNSLVVVYGSGEMDSLDCSESSTLQRNFVVSLAETIEPYTGRPGAACSPWSDQACRMAYTAASTDPDAAPSQPTWQVGPTLLWKKFLGFMGNMQPEHDPELPELPDLECERMMGQPVIFSSVAYFTTFTPNPETSCSAGIGRLYGAAFDSHRDNCSQMVPKLNSSQDPTKMVVTELIGTTTSGSIPYGLSVVTRPACSSGEAISGSTNPSGGSGAPFALAALAVPQLVVQTGVKAEDPKEIPTHGSPADPINMASRTIRRAVESIFVSSWGNLLD
jgi:Tfp pilus tip-associated adhesin PilY1